MATSISTPDPTAPAPRHETLTSTAAQVAALDQLIALATRSIRVFDVDLSETGWNRAERAETVAAFARRNARATLQIVVHNTRWIESSCPRLTRLLRIYGHVITIRRTGPDAASAMDPLTIVDERHYLHRFHVEQPKAEFVVGDPHAAKPLIERFDEIWNGAEPGLGATVLGL
jgi:hypothetical protein